MSHPLVITNGVVVLADRLLEGMQVFCREGKISSVAAEHRPAASTRIIDARGGFIAPGFIDMHVHGGAGADFMDGTEDAVRTACQVHARHGTTTIFPTTTTGSPEQIYATLLACKTVQHATQQATGGATIAGVHLYGPYFAEDKVGCHAVAGRREPLAEEYQRYLNSGVVRIATCAAELIGAAQFYKAAKRSKCLITCGHSNASYAEMQQAFKHGMRHVDHFWCAMSSVPSMRQRFGVPMQASMAEFVLLNQAMSTEVIADGWHLAPELLEFAYRMLGPERLCLVTDCNRALDMPPGQYRFGNKLDGSWLTSDGQVGWASNGSLASSVVGMDHMVRHMKKSTSATLPEVIRMASLTPAERTGIASTTGSIEVGKSADLLVLSKSLKVQHVIIRGTQFRRRQAAE